MGVTVFLSSILLLLMQIADSATLTKLFKEEGCTLQVIQPQRFTDPLWRLMAALEAQLSCLVGANAYITPAGELRGSWLRCGGSWGHYALLNTSLQQMRLRVLGATAVV